MLDRLFEVSRGERGVALGLQVDAFRMRAMKTSLDATLAVVIGVARGTAKGRGAGASDDTAARKDTNSDHSQIASK
jgi:hypothetical protein